MSDGADRARGRPRPAGDHRLRARRCVNIVRYARALTGVEHVHAVVGGFHLTGALFEPVIAPTVEALGALTPDLVLPAHCTGWPAMHALANRLPAAFIANSVGTRLELSAA